MQYTQCSIPTYINIYVVIMYIHFVVSLYYLRRSATHTMQSLRNNGDIHFLHVAGFNVDSYCD